MAFDQINEGKGVVEAESCRVVDDAADVADVLRRYGRVEDGAVHDRRRYISDFRD
jgi:hypothetical protein